MHFDTEIEHVELHLCIKSEKEKHSLYLYITKHGFSTNKM